MSAAFRSHGKGTLMFKRTFAGVRIERASGTTDPALYRKLRGMLDTLADAGRTDVLREVANGNVTPLELWGHYRGGDWSQLPTAAHVRPLKESFARWRTQVPGERHRQDLATYEPILASGAETIADLPKAVALLRVSLALKGRQFNKLRDAASAFLRATLTRQHPLYQAVRAIEPLPVTRTYARHPQDPAAARMIATTLGGEAGRIWWMLCCTGMGPKELWSDGWTEQEGHLVIHGQKRAGRERLVPLIVDLAPPTLTTWGFTSALRRSGLDVTPYDARRSFAFWLELARVWDTHQQAYMGHGRRTITDLYRGHDVTPFLDEDAQRLLDLVVGKVVGPLEGDSAQVVMRRLGIEPRTYGLKVRCERAPSPASSTIIPVDKGR
jgi:integrase